MKHDCDETDSRPATRPLQHPTHSVVTLVGGDILTVAGVTIQSGCTHTQMAGVAIGIGVVGMFSAVLGGVHISSGVAYNRNLGMQLGSGAGIQTSILGGVGIYSGVAYNTQGGLFSMFGCSVKQWVGAGVVINSGVTQNLVFGCNIFCGVGNFQGVGAGTVHNSGCVVALIGSGVCAWMHASSANRDGLALPGRAPKIRCQTHYPRIPYN